MFKKKEVIELYHFLKCVKGNWRNAIYIECHSCPYSSLMCSGYLLAFDINLMPVLYPIRKLQDMIDEKILKDECIGILDKKSFETLYYYWILWSTQNGKQCYIRKMHDELSKKLF